MFRGLVDSHCHLNLLEKDIPTALDDAKKAGVDYFLNVSVEPESIPTLINIAEKYSNVWASVGVHPTEKMTTELTTEEIIQLAANPRVIAIGETGLDYYRDELPAEIQQERFRRHIRAAKKTGKALIVHTREARADTIRILKEEGADTVGGVMHCFTENLEMAEAAIALNFYISFSGIVTFKNALELKEIAKRIPLEKILVETDSPYLAPVPYRGKPNEPAYVRFVAEYVAELRQITFNDVADQTTQNFFKLFKYAHVS